MRGMKRNLFWSVCYLVSLCITIFTMTVFGTIRGAKWYWWVLCVVFLVIQLSGLIYHLHDDPNTKEKGIARVGLFVQKLFCIGTFGLLLISLYLLASQYHNRILPTVAQGPEDNMTVIETEKLYILYPEYNSVDFVTGTRPSKSDKSVILCAAAAFQLTYNLEFTHDEICCGHVQKGVYYPGYYKKGLGAFTFYDGEYHFANPDEAAEELQRAVEHKGEGFSQVMIIDDGEIIPRGYDEYRCYRALAEIDGELCVIDSKHQTYFEDFLQTLKEQNVQNALYLDIGSGWNYSWYRDNKGKAITLIGLPWPFSHNWIAFKK